MTLDGKEITQEEFQTILQESTKNYKIKIVEVEVGVYKTLKRLEG